MIWYDTDGVYVGYIHKKPLHAIVEHSGGNRWNIYYRTTTMVEITTRTLYVEFDNLEKVKKMAEAIYWKYVEVFKIVAKEFDK